MSYIKKITAMARGTLVVDECLEPLAPYLEEKNIHVVIPEKKMSDDKIIKTLLANRIIVTNNSKDFINKASSFDYGIIATEHVNIQQLDTLANMISDAIIKNKLWSFRHGFILTLNADGKHIIEDLTD